MTNRKPLTPRRQTLLAIIARKGAKVRYDFHGGRIIVPITLTDIGALNWAGLLTSMPAKPPKYASTEDHWVISPAGLAAARRSPKARAAKAAKGGKRGT